MRAADNEVRASERESADSGDIAARRRALVRTRQRLRVKLLALVIRLKLLDSILPFKDRPSVAQRAHEQFQQATAPSGIQTCPIPGRAEIVYVTWATLELQQLARQSVWRNVVMLVGAAVALWVGFGDD